jgi:hypothetical protein
MFLSEQKNGSLSLHCLASLAKLSLIFCIARHFVFRCPKTICNLHFYATSEDYSAINLPLIWDSYKCCSITLIFFTSFSAVGERSLDRPFLIIPSVFSNVYLPISRYQNSMSVWFVCFNCDTDLQMLDKGNSLNLNV